MTPSAEELLAIARRYWREDNLYDFRIENSPEFNRFQALWREKLKEIGRWRSLLNELRRALPGYTIGNGTAPVNGGYGALVYPPREEVLHRPQIKWILVAYLSILAPVYTVYCVRRKVLGKQLMNARAFMSPIPFDLRDAAKKVSQRIEANYGATALPLEIAQTPVPLYVHFMKPPETTLFHALFTSEPWNIP